MRIVMIIHLLSIAALVLFAAPEQEIRVKKEGGGAPLTEEGINTYYVFKLEEAGKMQYALSVITVHPMMSYVPLVSRVSCSTYTQLDDLLKDLDARSLVNAGQQEALSFVQFGKACASACDTSIDKAAIRDLSQVEMFSIKTRFPEFREQTQVNLE